MIIIINSYTNTEPCTISIYDPSSHVPGLRRGHGDNAGDGEGLKWYLLIGLSMVPAKTEDSLTDPYVWNQSLD